MGSLTLNRRRRAIESQAFRPQPLTRFEWAILTAQCLVASGVIYLGFVALLSFR